MMQRQNLRYLASWILYVRYGSVRIRRFIYCIETCGQDSVSWTKPKNELAVFLLYFVAVPRNV